MQDATEQLQKVLAIDASSLECIMHLKHALLQNMHCYRGVLHTAMMSKES